MTGRGTDPSHHGIAQGDAAQMEQIRQSLVHVATDAANKAAQATVERLFVGLGVDVSKPEGIFRLQKVLAFSGDMLDARDTVKKTSARAAVGILTAGFISIIVLGLKDWIRLP